MEAAHFTSLAARALSATRRLEGRVTLVEDSQAKLEVRLEKLIRSEGKRSAARLSLIGALGVALIGAFAQWQVARVQAQPQKQNLESLVTEAARKGAEAALRTEKSR